MLLPAFGNHLGTIVSFLFLYVCTFPPLDSKRYHRCGAENTLFLQLSVSSRLSEDRAKRKDVEEEEIASFFQHVYEVKRRRERKCLKSVKTAAETVRTKGGENLCRQRRVGRQITVLIKRKGNYSPPSLARERENRLAKNVLRKRERQLSGRSDN